LTKPRSGPGFFWTAPRGELDPKQMASMAAVLSLFTSAILLGLPGVLTSAFARASSSEEKVWDRGRIDVLPPELRAALTRMCGPDLTAQQYFAGYFGNSKFLVLNFGRIRCGDRTAICTEGLCLHQVYRKVGDRYSFLRSYYGPHDD